MDFGFYSLVGVKDNLIRKYRSVFFIIVCGY